MKNYQVVPTKSDTSSSHPIGVTSSNNDDQSQPKIPLEENPSSLTMATTPTTIVEPSQIKVYRYI